VVELYLHVGRENGWIPVKSGLSICPRCLAVNLNHWLGKLQ
jgi:hypothetical protein